MSNTFHSGMLTLAGRPNVGKSTLLNRLIGRKISIVTPKPQTTRHRIVGIRNRPDAQFVFFDTPGMHDNASRAVNRYMNSVAATALDDADLVLMLVEAGRWTDEDERVLRILRDRPAALIVNKIDRIKPRENLLPYLAKVGAMRDWRFILPLAAGSGENVEQLDKLLCEHLPAQPAIYSADEETDQTPEFFVTEIVREKLMQRLHQELPYATTVTVDLFEERDDTLHIAATIWVERNGQKRIIIGKGGSQIRDIGRLARLELEERFGDHIFLELWVKVRSDWSDDERMLRELGYRSS